MNKKMLGFTTFLVTLAVASTAFAQDVDAAEWSARGWGALAAGLGLGIAAFGGAIGQSRAAAAALDGIARNPNASDKIFQPMIIGLALIESLVIYALIISYLLQAWVTG
ncbi:MAG: ATP synthase F0 subunit C [Sandaracinus sp.]